VQSAAAEDGAQAAPQPSMRAGRYRGGIRVRGAAGVLAGDHALHARDDDGARLLARRRRKAGVEVREAARAPDAGKGSRGRRLDPPISAHPLIEGVLPRLPHPQGRACIPATKPDQRPEALPPETPPTRAQKLDPQGWGATVVGVASRKPSRRELGGLRSALDAEQARAQSRRETLAAQRVASHFPHSATPAGQRPGEAEAQLT
jgi:hypothetical protein